MKYKLVNLIPHIGIAACIIGIIAFFVFNPLKWPEPMTQDQVIRTTELCRSKNMKIYWNNAGNRVMCGPSDEDMAK